MDSDCKCGHEKKQHGYRRGEAGAGMCCVTGCGCEKFLDGGTVTNKQDVRNRVGALFLMADEGGDLLSDGARGPSWWVVYMAGVKVFGSPDEKQADLFRDKMHAYVLNTLNL